MYADNLPRGDLHLLGEVSTHPIELRWNALAALHVFAAGTAASLRFARALQHSSRGRLQPHP